MTPSELESRRTAGEIVVREAGRLALSYYRSATLAIEDKGVQDVVSEADRACEALIVGELSRRFPDDGLLGEEGGQTRTGELTWIIDPIDGTANFVRGIPFWCVSIGLVSAGRAVVGLIYDPVADELFSASDSAGATRNGVPIKVSGETRIDRARIGVGFSYRRPVAPHTDAIRSLLEAKCEYLRLGSGALAMAYVADGRFDGYWERHINSWDVAAGLALVTAASGWTSDFFSGDGLKSGNEILAATPALADDLADLVGMNRRSD